MQDERTTAKASKGETIVTIGMQAPETNKVRSKGLFLGSRTRDTYTAMRVILSDFLHHMSKLTLDGLSKLREAGLYQPVEDTISSCCTASS